MARKLAKTTLQRFRKQLQEEGRRLEAIILELEEEREQARLNETVSDRSPDPDSVDGGAMTVEYEKEIAVVQNAEDLLRKVAHAEERLKAGLYGLCEVCGAAIPVARLEVLPYATTCVECASKR